MPTYLDLATWPRRPHFELFRGYDNPFFNVCAPVDVTELRQLVRARGLSFFIASLFLSTRAANAVEPFRYRLRGDRVLVHDVIHPGSTVLLPDDTFTFGYFEYTDDFGRFHETTSAELERLRSTPQDLRPGDDRDDLIHYSVLPWLAFTSFSHARNWDGRQSVPKIMLGKYFEEGGRVKMPVSVEVHHALMDGLHVGRYFEHLETALTAPDRALAP